MNLRDLRYLVAVAQLRHFGKAAEYCNVSQPALSMQLKKLEEYLGVVLFERSNKQVLVTDAGQKLVQRAQKVLAEADAMLEEAHSFADPFAGEIRLGAFPTLAPYVMPIIVRNIHKNLPQLRLFLVEEKTDALIERLVQGTLDVAILALPVNDPKLSYMPLFEEVFYLAVSTSHDLALHKEVSLSDLNGQNLLLLEEGHCLRNQALDVCYLGNAQENKEFRASSLETLRQMVVAEQGVTLMPAYARRADEEGVVYLPFDGTPPSRRIVLVFRRSTGREALFHKLVELIKMAMIRG